MSPELPPDNSAFAAALLRDSINQLLGRMDALDTLNLDHTITEHVVSGEYVETLKIHWRRPAPPELPREAPRGQ